MKIVEGSIEAKVVVERETLLDQRTRLWIINVLEEAAIELEIILNTRLQELKDFEVIVKPRGGQL